VTISSTVVIAASNTRPGSGGRRSRTGTGPRSRSLRRPVSSRRSPSGRTPHRWSRPWGNADQCYLVWGSPVWGPGQHRSPPSLPRRNARCSQTSSM